MELQFVKTNPSKNMTVLVETPLPREQHRDAAVALMDYGNVYAEQVGFIEPATLSGAAARLQMMGGEFCGNAALSLAAFLAWKHRPAVGRVLSIPLECSGSADITACKVLVRENDFQVTMAFPLPNGATDATMHFDGVDYPVTVVHLKGITHIILDGEKLSRPPKAFLAEAIRQWAKDFSDDACGIMCYYPSESRILPLVYVKSVDSLVWEFGCGTGTAATGIHLARKANGAISADIAQPGGCIHVDAAWNDNAATQLVITGNVSIAARGTAYITL